VEYFGVAEVSTRTVEYINDSVHLRKWEWRHTLARLITIPFTWNIEDGTGHL
jgi:hypothetical protein